MNEIKVSLIIPTYNSERTIKKTLDSIRQQSINQDEIEILIVDAGSTDSTREIAKQYDAQILENEKKLPEIAKHIGFLCAKGKYAIYIDSDEAFLNRNSLKRRVDFLDCNSNIKNLVSTGMVCQERERGIVRYANFIADPFSQFVYRFNGNYRLEDLCRDYQYSKEKSLYVFQVGQEQNIPLFDAAGNMFEVETARVLYEKCENKANFVANIFENMVHETKTFAVLEDDYIVHTPKLSEKIYFRKLKWRVKNNVFPEKNEGVGFVSRQGSSKHLWIRKYLYVVYCILLVPPFLDAVRFCVKKRDAYFLMHWIFAEYVFLEIVWYMLLKILHISVKANQTYAK